jgi:hypothetical protein
VEEKTEIRIRLVVFVLLLLNGDGGDPVHRPILTSRLTTGGHGV